MADEQAGIVLEARDALEAERLRVAVERASPYTVAAFRQVVADEDNALRDLWGEWLEARIPPGEMAAVREYLVTAVRGVSQGTLPENPSRVLRALIGLGQACGLLGAPWALEWVVDRLIARQRAIQGEVAAEAKPAEADAQKPVPPVCSGCPSDPRPEGPYCGEHAKCRPDRRKTDCTIMAAWKWYADQGIEPSASQVAKRLHDMNPHDPTDKGPSVRRWFKRNAGKTYRGITVRVTQREHDGNMTAT